MHGLYVNDVYVGLQHPLRQTIPGSDPRSALLSRGTPQTNSLSRLLASAQIAELLASLSGANSRGVLQTLAGVHFIVQATATFDVNSVNKEPACFTAVRCACTASHQKHQIQMLAKRA